MTHKRIESEWSTCLICGGNIYRVTDPPGRDAWWHEIPGRDFQHTASPAPRLADASRLAGVVGWVRRAWRRGYL